MAKKYQVYYEVHNEKAFMFETDDLLGIDLLIREYLRHFMTVDAFFQEVIVIVYNNENIVKRERFVFDYSYF